MNEHEHRELQSLLGAYALNATSDVEARRVERHLDRCDECATEIKLLRASAAELAWLAEPEDADVLVERITQNLPRRPRRIVTRVAVGVAAISIAAAGLLGAMLVNERSENSKIADVLAAATREVRLTPQAGFDGRGVLHIARDRAVLVLDELPDAGRDRSYQLWGIDAGQPRSLTVLTGEGRVVHLFDVDRVAQRYAVTIEPAGGSPVPTSDPVLLGT
jgi:anti-sigma-K factor RskA